VLLPDVLGTYSDAGNATVLAQRLTWRGIPVEVISCDGGSTPPTGCDIYLLDGGEDTAQVFAADWLEPIRAAQLRAREGRPIEAREYGTTDMQASSGQLILAVVSLPRGSGGRVRSATTTTMVGPTGPSQSR
jgi:hypothetical protein